MTDISNTVLITIRRFNLRRLIFPSLAIGASLYAIARLIGDAASLTYVAPYTSLGRRPQSASDEDLEGRDPDW